MFISVIVTAYNRRTYIMDALKSVLDQTLSREKWEMIVVKNFNDEAVDSFLIKNGIKNIIMEGTIGEFLYEGVKNSKGEVISFLDDDDIFLREKLECVFGLFSMDDKLVYYHNDSLICSSDLTVKERSRITKNPAFNLSSISIRKGAINLDNLTKIWTTQDVFMFISAKENGGKVKIGKSVQTFYRINNESTQTSKFENIDEYVKNKIRVLGPAYKQLVEFSNFFPSRKAKIALERYRLASYSYLMIFSGSGKVKLWEYVRAITLIPSFLHEGGISTLLNLLISRMPSYFKRKYLFHLYRGEERYQRKVF